MNNEELRKVFEIKSVEELNKIKDLIDEEIEKIETLSFEKAYPNLKDHNVKSNLNEFYIDDVLIDDSIFQEEKHEYQLVDREDQIDHLHMWITEAIQSRNTQVQLMKDDLEYLQSINDIDIFSSISTNNYVAKSDDKKQFCEICEEILALNEELKVQIKEEK